VTVSDRSSRLEAIAAEVRACTRCRLAAGRTRAVPGEGSPETEVVFVGEGPGQNEDRQGRPFVGAAGSLLERLLALIGWRREDVFITNVVKCRPPNNRDPEPDEIAACAPYLRRQLEVLDPAVVVTLGRFSLQTFMPGDRISRVHGTARAIDPATGARDASGYALYHPAAALRQASLQETMQRDVAAIPELLLRARARRAAARQPDAAMGASAVAPAMSGDGPGLDAGTSSGPPDTARSEPTTTASHPPSEEHPMPITDDQIGLF
jgi:uracil-DNA glycosylase family 4